MNKFCATVETSMVLPQYTPSPVLTPKYEKEELAYILRKYILSRASMLRRGYPVGIANSTKAIMFINPPTRTKLWTPEYGDKSPLTSLNVNAPSFFPGSKWNSKWDVHAPEFVPGSKWKLNVPEFATGSQADTGRSSVGSTPRSESDIEANTVEHVCVRCERIFKMTHDGDYFRQESCYYHFGRLIENKYECCSRYVGASGCTTCPFHVRSGTKPGINGPLEGYVRARHRRGGVFALDAEMYYTTAGFELASIAVIGVDGHIVYKEYVKPTSPVVDYNTRFSGIQPHHVLTAEKTLKDVQNDILLFVGTDTILIGHALENDLRALKLLHSAVVDTSALYPHPKGLPMRRSLRDLSIEVLGRPVQDRKSGGHSPVEDARTALDLVLVKVNRDHVTAEQNLVHRNLAAAKQIIVHRERRPTKTFRYRNSRYDPLSFVKFNILFRLRCRTSRMRK